MHKECGGRWRERERERESLPEALEGERGGGWGLYSWGLLSTQDTGFLHISGRDKQRKFMVWGFLAGPPTKEKLYPCYRFGQFSGAIVLCWHAAEWCIVTSVCAPHGDKAAPFPQPSFMFRAARVRPGYCRKHRGAQCAAACAHTWGPCREHPKEQ